MAEESAHARSTRDCYCAPRRHAGYCEGPAAAVGTSGERTTWRGLAVPAYRRRPHFRLVHSRNVRAVETTGRRTIREIGQDLARVVRPRLRQVREHVPVVDVERPRRGPERPQGPAAGSVRPRPAGLSESSAGGTRGRTGRAIARRAPLPGGGGAGRAESVPAEPPREVGLGRPTRGSGAVTDSPGRPRAPPPAPRGPHPPASRTAPRARERWTPTAAAGASRAWSRGRRRTRGPTGRPSRGVDQPPTDGPCFESRTAATTW